MYSLHLKYLSTMADMALTCSQAYTTALNAQLEAAAEATETASERLREPQQGSAPRSSARQDDPPSPNPAGEFFTFPEIPEPGQSWYRAPFENPFLAFWDQMLSPWRTYSASGWPPSPFSAAQVHGVMMPGAQSQPFDGLNVAFAFAPWLQQWGNLAMHTANAMASAETAIGPAGNTPKGSAAQPGAFATIALAKIRFPDNTEVTISVPYLPLIFAGAPFPKFPSA